MTSTSAHLPNGKGKHGALSWDTDVRAFREYLIANPDAYRALVGQGGSGPTAVEERGTDAAASAAAAAQNPGSLPASDSASGSTLKSRPRSIPGFPCFGFLAKTALFSVWLLLPMLALSASYCLRVIHDDYFSVVVKRAERSDEDLLDEFTYYGRPCNAYDITGDIHSAGALVLEKGGNSSSVAKEGVDIMMKHGALVMPKLLSQDTIRDLREFIDAKNRAIKGTAAEYPMSQGYKRVSYGIEATEHPTVIRALREVYDDERLGKVLAALVGHENPALTEITAITASYGASHQTWHPDVKPDGNALQFGRTYSHSYSLFLPLQDTTQAMGATHLCPGTHYCTDDLALVCDEHTVPLSDVTQDGNAWNAGDAALLNQQVWHRGAAHTDPNAPDRIAFIVSFIGRPQTHDPRQLARGTYFHMKWNMWGHTWEDLSDSAFSMIRPFNVLRCMRLWKPSTRKWGYDLVTAVALRMANYQLGCEPEDVLTLASTMKQLGLPDWLAGTVDPHNQYAWHNYIAETISNVFAFVVRANIALLSAYGAVVLLASVVVQICYRKGGFRVMWASTKRMFWIAAFTSGVTAFVLHRVKTSPWGQGISSGVTLRRPFPNAAQRWENDPELEPFVTSYTTAPERRDVLVGARLHTNSIGAYSKWLDYHPGNEELRNIVDGKAGGELYRSYKKGLPPIFARQLMMQISNSIRGRILLQNYENGDWFEVNEFYEMKYLHSLFYLGNTNGLLSEIKGSLDILLDRERFGLHRGTILSRVGQTYLQWLEKKLLSEPQSPVPQTKARRSLAAPVSHIPSVHHLFESEIMPLAKHWTSFPTQILPDFVVGDRVWYIGPNNLVLPATVTGTNYDQDRYDVAFDGDATYDRGEDASTVQLGVPGSLLVRNSYILDGARVMAKFEEADSDDMFPGTIQRVRPSREVDVAFDDGDFEHAISPDRYQLVA